MELETIISDSDFHDTYIDDSHAPTPLLQNSLASITSDDEQYFSTRETLEVVDQLRRLKQVLHRALETRQLETVIELLALKKEIEESYDKSRKAKIGGTVATVTGAALGIVGFGLAFVTFGASLPLLVVGGVVGAAGGTTMAGADIGYAIVSHKRIKRVMEVCENEKRQMDHIGDLVSQIQENLRELRASYPQYTEEQLLELILERGTLDVRNLKPGHAIHAGRIAVVTGDAAKIGAQIAARAFGRALFVAGAAVGGVAAALDLILIPIDIGLMVKAAIDIHMYNGGKGKSNSDAAKEVGKIISNLNNHTEKMRDMYTSLQKL